MRRQLSQSNGSRGATMLVWLLVISVSFAALISSLLTGNAYAHRKSIENYKKAKALYAAEGAIAYAFADMKESGSLLKTPRNYPVGDSEAEITITNEGGAYNIISIGKYIKGNGEWRETLKVTAEGAPGSLKIKKYRWMGQNEKQE